MNIGILNLGNGERRVRQHDRLADLSWFHTNAPAHDLSRPPFFDSPQETHLITPLASSSPVATYIPFVKSPLPYLGSSNHLRPEVDV